MSGVLRYVVTDGAMPLSDPVGHPMHAQLTTELLARFVGGQMESQNSHEGYLFRGEIAEIKVVDGELAVHFSWLAEAEGFPPAPTGWVKARDELLDYVLDLGLIGAADIGPGEEGDSRVAITSPITGELITLFPPNGSKLDRSRVPGL